MSSIAKRLIVAAGLICLLFVVLYFGGWLQAGVFTALTVISVFEIGRAYSKCGINVFMPPLYMLAALYYVLFKLFNMAFVDGLMLLTILLITGERVLSDKRTTEEAVIGLSIMIYPLLLYISMMRICELADYELSRKALFSVFAMPLMGDTFAFVFGCAFGRHKLAPRISPNKTTEGAVAAVFGGAAGGLLVYFVQRIWGGTPVSLGALLITGFVCGIVGQIGDLFASAIKRWAGIKDYGKIFPGHGGVMDRLDSVLLSAPVVLFMFNLIL